MICSESERSTGSVHCHVSAADYCNLAALHDRRLRVVQICLHEVGSCQVFVSREYSLERFARNVHEHRKSRAGADEYRLKSHLIEELIYSQGLSDDNVRLDVYTEVLEAFNFPCHDGLRKPEFRDAVYKYAACRVQSLEYGYLVTLLCEVSCAGES